jgi:hypothetical protein
MPTPNPVENAIDLCRPSLSFDRLRMVSLSNHSPILKLGMTQRFLPLTGWAAFAKIEVHIRLKKTFLKGLDYGK